MRHSFLSVGVGVVLVVMGGVGTAEFSAGAAETYVGSRPVAERLRVALEGDAVERLRAATDRYNAQARDEASVRERLKAAGFQESEVAALAPRVMGGADARWTGSAIRIESNGHSVEIGPKEYMKGTLRIDGREFFWDWRRSADRNLKSFDVAFPDHGAGGPPATHGLMRWLLGVPTASAGDQGTLFQIKASGLDLFFTVGAVGEISEELFRLNAKVKDMLASCRSPEPSNGKDDPFTAAVLQGTIDSQRFQGDPLVLRSCSDVRGFASRPVATVQGEPVFPRLPADLCGNIDALAVCVHSQMEPASVSDGHIKRKPRDADEWYEPSAAKAGPASRAAH